jgi:hypothetical protein
MQSSIWNFDILNKWINLGYKKVGKICADENKWLIILENDNIVISSREISMLFPVFCLLHSSRSAGIIQFSYYTTKVLQQLVAVSLTDWMNEVQFPADLPVCHHIQTGSGTHPASYPMVTTKFFPKDNVSSVRVKLATKLPIVPRLRMWHLCHSSPVHLSWHREL